MKLRITDRRPEADMVLLQVGDIVIVVDNPEDGEVLVSVERDHGAQVDREELHHISLGNYAPNDDGVGDATEIDITTPENLTLLEAVARAAYKAGNTDGLGRKTSFGPFNKIIGTVLVGRPTGRVYSKEELLAFGCEVLRREQRGARLPHGVPRERGGARRAVQLVRPP